MHVGKKRDIFPDAMKGYARRARQFLKNGHNPTGVTRRTMHRYADSFEAHAKLGSRFTPGRIVQAATMVGFVESATVLDTSLRIDERYQKVRRDHATFTQLVEMSGRATTRWSDRIPPLVTDVDFMTDMFFARHGSWATPIPAHQTAYLNSILANVRERIAVGGDVAIVLDLDGTLFTGTPRHVRIIRQAADEHRQLLSSLSRNQLLSITPDQLGYDPVMDLPMRFGFTTTPRLKRLGIDYDPFVEAFKKMWWGNFFSNDCVNDKPYPGAVEFVNALHDAGAKLVYFTGRHSDVSGPSNASMHQGTLAGLAKHAFPVPNDETVILIMKSNHGVDDVAYKQATLDRIDALGTVVAAFDNEPKMVMMFKDRWPNATVVRVGRAHTPIFWPGRPAPLLHNVYRPTDIPTIADFRMQP